MGTQFNVNAYDDEPSMKTTLLEGSVKVILKDQKAILKPGQQAVTKSTSSSIIVQNADLDEAVAWKNGYFKFEGEDLQSVMRKVSRWYNVDVTYQGNFGDNITFLGEVSRSKNISAVLKIMEATGNVHFQVTGRRVVVMP
jgi:transmembrane sensor